MEFSFGKAIGAGLSIFGSDKEAKGYEESGRRAAERGREQRIFNEAAASQARAVGSHQAYEETRQAKIMASRAVAVAAAGGASMDIANLIADIEGEGVYRAALAMHAAETEAVRLEFEGEQAERYGADQAAAYEDRADAARISGLSTLFSLDYLDYSDG